MRMLFADALYWVALLNPRDQWHQKARKAGKKHASARLVTTEAVLVEVLNFFAAFRPEMRRTTVEVVRDLIDDARVEIVPYSHSLFMDGLEMYSARLDKSYSMVDCMSMQVMRSRKLTDVLTHDHHFMQEGFNTLL